MSAPLAGVLVVALEQAVAAPTATHHLVELGARVLKIERPDGGDFARHYDHNVAGESAYFVWLNHGKDSLVLDLTTDTGRRELDELIAGADVFVQNLSPAAAGRLGVTAAQLLERHPRLIACDVSGYGPGGPRTDDKAYDLAIQAEGGAIALTGSEEQMSKVGLAVADSSAGLYALSSILAALVRRDRTGEGAAISISMLECVTELTSAHVLTAAATGSTPARSARRHPMVAPYGLFELADGSTILIAVQSDREWRAMAEVVLERPELADDPRFTTNAARAEHVDEVEAAIVAVLVSTSAGEVLDRLGSARITVARVRTPIEVWHHEQHAARDRKLEVTTPSGTAQVWRSPLNISGHEGRGGRVPALGEHDPDLVRRLRERR